MTTEPELLRRPVTGRPNPRSTSEQHFLDWLGNQGHQVEGWECEEFFLPEELSRPASWLRPDCKLVNGIFLEHTDADKIMRPQQLTKLIRQRNLAKESKKDWISPRDYLQRKCSRIALAEGLYGITVVLLPAVIRQQLESSPAWLTDLIALRKANPAGYDAYLFCELPAYLLDELPVPA